MPITSLNDLHTVPQPAGDDVDALPRANQIRSKGSSHVVYGTCNAAPLHVALKRAAEVVAVTPRTLELRWSNGVFVQFPVAEETMKKLLEVPRKRH